MTYFIWGLLNMGIFIFFIVICFKATKLIREKIGLFAAIIFVFGLLSFMGKSNYDNNHLGSNSNQVNDWKFIAEENLPSKDSYSIDIDLDKSLFTKFDISIKYCKTNNNKLHVPISANSNITGLVSGVDWKVKSIILNKTEEINKFEYFVDGVVEWKLLGTRFYSQLKRYKGFAYTK